MDRKQDEARPGEAVPSLPADLLCLQGGGGGGQGAVALAMLEKQLICPICLEVFSKPVVILPCQHNLCRKCANELYQPSLFQPRTTMLVNSGRFRCPSCRHEVLLDRHGVYGLQRNLLVENIIDVYKQEVGAGSSSRSPAPPAAPPPTQETCSHHAGERVNIYCLTCQVPTCSLCKVFGEHRSCQVAPLEEIYQQQKDELSEEIRSLVAVNDKIQTVIYELEKTCRNIEENGQSQKQSVCERFNQVFSILEERKKALTQQISSEQEEQMGHVQALVRCYGDSVEANNKLVERAVSSMEEADMAAFVQNSRELIQTVTAATGSRPADTLKPGCGNLGSYACDFSRQEEALRGIDFLKVVEEVPAEPELEESEEPPEPSVQNTEPEHCHENSTQDHEPAAEPVKEPIPALSPPVEPAAPTPAAVPPGPGLVGGAVLEAEDDDVNEGEKKTEEEEGREDLKGENVCEHQEGMSSQQFEGGEAEGKHDAQEEGEEEEEMEEEMDVMLHPSWYKPRTVPAEVLVYAAEQKPAEPRSQNESQPRGQSGDWPRPPPLLHDPQTRPQTEPADPDGGLTPGLQMQEVEGAEPEEDEDTQGWVCPPGGSSSDDQPAEEASGPDGGRSVSCESSDGGVEDAEEEEEEEEGGGLGDCDAAAMIERLEQGGVCRDEGSKLEEEGQLEGSGRTGGVRNREEESEASGLTEEKEAGGSRERPEDGEKQIPSLDSLQALALLFYLLVFLALLQRFWAYVGCFICT